MYSDADCQQYDKPILRQYLSFLCAVRFTSGDSAPWNYRIWCCLGPRNGKIPCLSSPCAKRVIIKKNVANQNKYLRTILWKIMRLARRSVSCECEIHNVCLHHCSWHRATYISVLVMCNIYTGLFRVRMRTIYASDPHLTKEMTTRKQPISIRCTATVCKRRQLLGQQLRYFGILIYTMCCE